MVCFEAARAIVRLPGVRDEDLASVVKSFFGVKEGEADSEFLSNLHDLCELTATLFHANEEDVRANHSPHS